MRPHLFVGSFLTAALLLSSPSGSMASGGATDESVSRAMAYYPDYSKGAFLEAISSVAAENGVTEQEAVDEIQSEEIMMKFEYQESTTGGGGSGAVGYLGTAGRVGDVFYKPSSTGHVGIYHTQNYFTEAPGIGKDVRSTYGPSYGVPKGTKKQYVSTYSSRRNAAGSWARTKVGAAYNAAGFAFNKKTGGPKYNCSQLVWAAYRVQGNDLDSNGGTGVYPRNIRDSPLTVTYKSF